MIQKPYKHNLIMIESCFKLIDSYNNDRSYITVHHCSLSPNSMRPPLLHFKSFLTARLYILNVCKHFCMSSTFTLNTPHT